MPSSPSDHLVELVGSGSTDALAALAGGLESGTVTLESSSVGIAAIHGVDDELAMRAFETFQTIRADLDEAAVATAIRVAGKVRIRERLDRPAVEIYWTGPETEGPLVTPTAAAVERLLQDCRDVGEILLVGYSLTVPEGSFMAKVINLLLDASKRRAKIEVVLHQDPHAKNKHELLASWDIFARKPEIYTWDPPADHPYTKLHAKCVVVDRLQMLITSANFTFHGLESNIELGLLVRNQPLASAVHERFDHLIRTGVLQPWKDFP